MTGEARIVQGALTWSVGLAIPATAIAWWLAGANAAASVGCAALVVVLNLGLTVAFDRLGRRFDARTRVILSLPSLAVRMVVALTALSILRAQAFIDAPVFVASFCATLILVLVLQSRDWKRTPWLAIAFGPAEKETL
jgi:hypothetical protein